MADFKTGLSEIDTSLPQVQARQKPDHARQAVADAAFTVAGVAGRAAARSSAAGLSGAEYTEEEVNDRVQLIDDEIQTALTTERNEVEGPISPSRISEIKDVALSEFADNDRVLKGLRDQSVISTVEARARRTLNLQRALSNPINALFRKDFMNAASDLTGGGEGAGGAFLDYTPAEKQSIAVADAQRKEIARINAEIAGIATSTGQPVEVVRSEYQARNIDQQEIERIRQIQEKSDLDYEVFFDKTRANASRGIYADVLASVQNNQGKGLNASDMSKYGQLVEQSYNSMLEGINRSAGSSKWKDAERVRIEKWKTNQNALIKTYDQAEINKLEVAEFEAAAAKIGMQLAPQLMGLKVIDKELAIALIKSGGNLENRLNLTLGGTQGTQLMDSLSTLNNLEQFVTRKGVDNPGAPISALNSPQGIDYLTSDETLANDNVRSNLRSEYLNASEASLNTYNGMYAMSKAPKSVNLQNEISTAMNIIKRKMDGTRAALVSEDLLDPANMITTKRREVTGTSKVKKVERVYIDFPDAMEANQNELLQMYKTIANHPWAWEHVADDYLDAADAFDGFMRGEWQFTPNLQSSVSTNQNPRGKGAIAPKTGDGAGQDEQTGKPTQPAPVKEGVPDQTGGRPLAPVEAPSIAEQNNNPGNLRGIGISYEGKVGEVDTPSGKFSKFETPEMGMRALARDLDVKIGRGVNTIDKIIRVFSPEDDPENVRRGLTPEPYIEFVEKQTGINRNAPLTRADRFKIMKAITAFEAGANVWDDELIIEGIALAGTLSKTKKKKT